MKHHQLVGMGTLIAGVSMINASYVEGSGEWNDALLPSLGLTAYGGYLFYKDLGWIGNIVGYLAMFVVFGGIYAFQQEYGGWPFGAGANNPPPDTSTLTPQGPAPMQPVPIQP
jgi:hypothetical protein